MKRTIIVTGFIAGFIVAAFMLASMAKIFNLNNYEGSMLLGYTTMLVAFSLIFVAVKNNRDKYGNGVITFGKAFTTGLMITLIASTIYVIVWMIDYFYFIPDFYEKYSAHELLQLKAAGGTQAQLSAKAAEIQQFSKLYRNPFFNALVTYAEILPVGLIVSLLAAVILKRKANHDKAIVSQ
ncbi:DUF4199 domain-containing protein [Mucilaginibacter xinganensis]|nr:DUF4199 domain-containing protein [Mucilaginibacter xinganensis]